MQTGMQVCNIAPFLNFLRMLLQTYIARIKARVEIRYASITIRASDEVVGVNVLYGASHTPKRI